MIALIAVAAFALMVPAVSAPHAHAGHDHPAPNEPESGHDEVPTLDGHDDPPTTMADPWRARVAIEVGLRLRGRLDEEVDDEPHRFVVDPHEVGHDGRDRLLLTGR